MLEKIQGLVVPKRFKENVDLATLMIRAKPYYDNEELLSMCYRLIIFRKYHLFTILSKEFVQSFNMTVKVAWWKKRFCICSHRTANLSLVTFLRTALLSF